jgi:glycosyltransferase involved in cell wall biosynthesis
MAILARFAPGRLISLVTEKCYAVTADAAEVARDFYGVQAHKIEVAPLGFDGNWFHLPDETGAAKRVETRASLGFDEGDVVCIYTGRLNEFKNPLLLARAIAKLRDEGLPFRGLYVGGGEQAEEIERCNGSVVHSFVPADDLARLYWASDVAVWPRSYSASQVEALACGLPVVMTDESQKKELDEFVIKYRQLDLDSMVATLRTLASEEARKRLSVPTAMRVRETLSWDVIARKRSADYLAAVESHKRTA